MMKLKKIFSVLTALMTAVVLPLSAMAETEEINPELSGYVTLMVDGGFILNDQNFGQVLCNTDDTTVLEGYIADDGFGEGDYVIVQYDGRMTRSLPPQVHADRISSYRLDGVVLEIMTENTLAIDVPEQGEVWVYAEDLSSNIIPGMNVTVFYDGIMALSYPARVSARELVLPEVTGTVGEITENGFMLNLEEGQVEIATSGQTRYSQLKAVESTEETEASTTEEVLFEGSVTETPKDPAPETQQPAYSGESTESEEVLLSEEAAEPSEESADEPAGDAEEIDLSDADSAETSDEEEASQPTPAPDVENETEVLSGNEEPDDSDSADADQPAITVSAADYLKEGDLITVYYGGVRGGEGPLHALKIILLP